MNKSIAVKAKIIMFPCAGISNVGQLTIHAVQELVLEGKGKWFGCLKNTDLQIWGHRTVGSPPFIVVDGCEQHCAKKRFEAINHDLEFHLSLADLGIEKTELSEIVHEELQLVKDAIVAECTRLAERPPMITGGCCCR